MKNVWQGPNQLIFPCLKSTIETLEKDVKYVQSQQYKHQNDVIWTYFLLFLVGTVFKQI